MVMMMAMTVGVFVCYASGNPETEPPPGGTSNSYGGNPEPVLGDAVVVAGAARAFSGGNPCTGLGACNEVMPKRVPSPVALCLRTQGPEKTDLFLTLVICETLLTLVLCGTDLFLTLAIRGTKLFLAVVMAGAARARGAGAARAPRVGAARAPGSGAARAPTAGAQSI